MNALREIRSITDLATSAVPNAKQMRLKTKYLMLLI